MSVLDPIVPVLPIYESLTRSSVMNEPQNDESDESAQVLGAIVEESLFSIHEECVGLEGHIVSLLSEEEEESEDFSDGGDEDPLASSTTSDEADFDQTDLFTNFDGEAGEEGGNQSLFPIEENSKSEYSEEDSDIFHKLLKAIKLQKKHIKFQKNKAKRSLQ